METRRDRLVQGIVGRNSSASFEAELMETWPRTSPWKKERSSSASFEAELMETT